MTARWVTCRPDSEIDGATWIEMADEEGRNSFSADLIAGLLDAFATVSGDPKTRVVILAGTPEYFCTGATRQALRDLQDRVMSPTELVLGRRLIDIPVPVIAAAEGSAIGGGLALMLSADLVVAAERSHYGANFMELGITPGMGMTVLLEDALPRRVAHEMLYGGVLRRGRDLAGSASLNAVVPRAAVRAKAQEIAWTIAGRPRHNLCLLKRALSMPRRRALEEAMTLESLMHESSLAHLDESQMGPNP